MDLRELKLFMAVAEHLNFRAAAESLHMTQPPLTRAIALLEEDLEVRLFHRTTRRVELTPAGLALLVHCREIFNRVEEARWAVRKAQKPKTDHLRIGVSPSVVYSSLMNTIWNYRSAHPKVRVDVVEGRSGELKKRLKHADLNIILVEDVSGEQSGLESLSLQEDSMGVLVPAGHPLEHRKKLSIQDLDQQTLIMHDRNELSCFYQAIASLIAQSGVRTFLHHRREGENCASLVAVGQGLLLTTAALSRLAPSQTSSVPLDCPEARFNLRAYWPSDEISPALSQFLMFLRNQDLLPAPASACLMSHQH